MEPSAGGPAISATGILGTSRAPLRRLAALLSVTAVIFALTASYSVFQNHDTRAAATGAWSLGTRGTTVLPSDWPEDGISWPVVSDNGDVRVNRFPGVLYWGAVFYGADALLFGQTATAPHPYLVDYRPAAVAAITATALGMAVLYLVFLQLASSHIAFLGALTFALATSTWSISANALWTHGLTHLFLALAILLLAQERPWAAGASAALSIFSRPQTAIAALALGAGRAWHRRDYRDLIRLGVPSAVGLLAVVAYSWHNFRTPLPISGYEDYASERLANPSPTGLVRGIVGTLFHPYRGILPQSPFLIILALGLRPAWRAAPTWVRQAAIAGVSYQMLQLVLNHFSGGIFFYSYRLPLEMLVLASPLLLLSFTETVLGSRWREIVFVVGVSIGVAMQLLSVTTLSVGNLVAPELEDQILEVCSDPGLDCSLADLQP